LLDPGTEEYEVLKDAIKNVEAIVFMPEEIDLGLSLYDIEMSMESNLDFFSYFERPDGVQVSKFDVERELNKIKQWIYSIVRQKASTRRFRRMIR
jgi:hypothetical protein